MTSRKCTERHPTPGISSSDKFPVTEKWHMELLTEKTRTASPLHTGNPLNQDLPPFM
ncbi:hypothetical protein HF072_04345 [Bacillus sp. RO3]|nr:hypothetical protein [Bacillus sp. RO3]